MYRHEPVYNTTLSAVVSVPNDVLLEDAKEEIVAALANAGYDPHAIRLTR